MPSKVAKLLLQALTKAKIELDDETRSRVTEEFETLELPAGDVVGPDQKVVALEDWREIHKDLKDWKSKARKAEGDLSELREAVDSGDSDNARKAAKFKEKLEKIEPLLSEFMSRERTRWAELQGKIPEDLKSFFKFAKEGEELEDAIILANTGKLDEYIKIKAIDLEAEPAKEKPGETPPDTPKMGPDGQPPDKSKEDLTKLHPDVAMEKSYKYQPPKPTP